MRQATMAAALLHPARLTPFLALQCECRICPLLVPDGAVFWLGQQQERGIERMRPIRVSRSSSLSKPSKRPGRKGSGEKELENLVVVRRSDGKWSHSWESQHVTTLEELGLKEMAVSSAVVDTGNPRADVVIVDLFVSKAGWGFFVKGRVLSSVLRQCNRCFSNFSSAVDSPFEAWLSPTRDEFMHPQQTGEDNDDPTVVYFPPGRETADLTAMVRDTIRLSLFSKAMCSEACEHAGTRQWEVGAQDRLVDRSWSPLLEALRKAQL